LSENIFGAHHYDAVIAIAFLSVCLSVCLSHSYMDDVEMVPVMNIQFSSYITLQWESIQVWWPKFIVDIEAFILNGRAFKWNTILLIQALPLTYGILTNNSETVRDRIYYIVTELIEAFNCDVNQCSWRT